MWVQVSVAPPNEPDRSIDLIVQDARSILRFIDGLSIFYPILYWNKVKDVLSELRYE